MADVAESHASRVISSVRVEVGGAHDFVSIWSRGGFAGQLVLKLGDGAKLVALLEAAQGYAAGEVRIASLADAALAMVDYGS